MSIMLSWVQTEEHTPIKQDIKKGKLRNYPYNINWNYGMLPRTWENPEVTNQELGGIAVCSQSQRCPQYSSPEFFYSICYELQLIARISPRLVSKLCIASISLGLLSLSS